MEGILRFLHLTQGSPKFSMLSSPLARVTTPDVGFHRSPHAGPPETEGNQVAGAFDAGVGSERRTVVFPDHFVYQSFGDKELVPVLGSAPIKPCLSRKNSCLLE